MRKLRYLAQAREDLIKIKRYIARESGSSQLALQFTDKLRSQCRHLAEFPGVAGRARPELRQNLRSSPFGNYVIFFQYDCEFLEVVSIIEGHRDIEALFSER